MKKTVNRLIELLPFFSILVVLGFIAYWQFAQYTKINQLEQHLINSEQKISDIIRQQQLKYHQLRYQLEVAKTHKKILSPIDKNKPIENKPIKSKKTILEEASKLPLKRLKKDNHERINSKQTVVAKIEKATIITKENLHNNQLILADKKQTIRISKLEQTLKRCKKHLKAYQLTQGSKGNAYDCYLSILQQDKNNKYAIAGIKKIEQKYQQTINKYIKLNKFSKAEHFIAILSKINPKNKLIPSLQRQLDQAKLLTTASSPPPASLTQVPLTIVEDVTADKDELMDNTYTLISAGCFNKTVDKKQQTFCVDSDFLISKYELTQKQWTDMMGNNPSRIKGCGANCPVENVSWFDIQDYIRKLNQKSETKYRLPTEKEWEYAARAGNNGLFSFGDNVDLLSEYANFCDKQCGNDWKDISQQDGFKFISPVGSFKANSWGLYDMHGNVWEWVADKEGDLHVYKGGSWGDNYLLCQSSSRGKAKPDFRVSGIGFRLVKIK